MKNRKGWNLLKQFAKRIGVRIVVLSEYAFCETFADDIYSLFDPINMIVFMNQGCFKNEDLALFSLAHELGHAVDHVSEPERSEEYHFYYLLDSFYSTFPLPPPEACRKIFRDREEMATTIGLNLLEEFGITLDLSALADYPFILSEVERGLGSGT